MTAVDTSADALAIARAQCRSSTALDDARVEWIEADVFQLPAAASATQGRSFDLIVLDPPKFAPTAAHAERAARGYKDINLLAFKLLPPAACSRPFRARAAFRATCSRRSSPARRSMPASTRRFCGWLSAAPDHPVALSFPEGEYLKGLLCRVS